MMVYNLFLTHTNTTCAVSGQSFRTLTLEGPLSIDTSPIWANTRKDCAFIHICPKKESEKLDASFFWLITHNLKKIVKANAQTY